MLKVFSVFNQKMKVIDSMDNLLYIGKEEVIPLSLELSPYQHKDFKMPVKSNLSNMNFRFKRFTSQCKAIQDDSGYISRFEFGYQN